MKIMLAFFVAFISVESSESWASDDPASRELGILIDQLVGVSELGLGYSDSSSGSEFLPLPDTHQVATLVLGSPPPRPSPVLERIVRVGAPAVPQLLWHLDDDRKTAIPPLRGMMWIAQSERLDHNKRIINDTSLAKDVRIPSTNQDGYRITVGDLCYVALGQIVNRYFLASRYEPTAGLVISSPTRSKRLCETIRREFAGFNVQRHLAFIRDDFLKPDFEDRRIGAYIRLAFYYPDEIEALVLKQLTVPTFDAIKVESFVRGRLYCEQSVVERKNLFDRFVLDHGIAAKDGILLQLFGDLEIFQEAWEWERDHKDEVEVDRPLNGPEEKWNPRSLLIELYGYKPGVKSGDHPFVESWEQSEKVRFIEALVYDKSKKIDLAVVRILRGIMDDDDLALACIRRLTGRGYDGDVRSYCERRVGMSQHHNKEFQRILGRLVRKRPL